MMIFDILTIFPHILDSYISESIIGREIKKKNIKIRLHDIRAYSKERHKKVDATPYGGGAGMVMTPQPLFDCIKAVKRKNPKAKVIYMSPLGKVLITGGELPAMVVIDAVTRLAPGALGNKESAAEESFTEALGGKKEYPHYTKPREFKKIKVPPVLLTGDHAKIKAWRMKHLK
ncbi:MAG: tRNA (guanine-N(1)-)-methyltransferase [Candidatus Peregrinibacteria bacterium GW2011_GWA2_47_7]|nr:MAG: tRNA (guanine-N(1)-)-methyltransferase [Candidatus Peregrinibacteria bacterium GW2011_GWA2_47_7]